MKSLYTQKIKVLASQTDSTAKLGVTQALTLFQDNMCEYYKNMNCDGVYLVPRCHAFWALTKTKIRFNKAINWLDKLEIKTDICKLSNIRMNLSSIIIDERGEGSLDCLHELCGMDSETRSLRTVDSIPFFPKDIEVNDSFSNLFFEKMDFSLDESDYVETVTIRSNNVDFFGHTNNVEYVKILLATFASDFIKSINCKEFEIHYLKETREKDRLRIYKRIVDNLILFEVRMDNNVILKSKMNVEYIDS